MRFALPAPVLDAISRLNQAGFDAYLVGGCVRDDYLGILPHDYDISTSALPQDVQAVFAQDQRIEIGLRHGTVGVRLGGMALEITTFRSDLNYTDNRHPDAVAFCRTLAEDIKRRDFTINAMAWHPSQGLVDLAGGREDCDRRLIRAVGDPLARFGEDALRILRALRFGAQLGFAIEPATAAAMQQQAKLLDKISPERIAAELTKLLVGQAAAPTLRRHPHILMAALPELAPMLDCPQRSRFHIYDVWEHTLQTLLRTPPVACLRWAALLHDSGKPHTRIQDADGTTHFYGHQAASFDIASQVLRRLRFSRLLQQDITRLVCHHDERIRSDNLLLWLSRLGPELFFKLLQLQKADMGAHAPGLAKKRLPQLEALRQQAKQYVRGGGCLSLQQLALSGRDLLQMGYAPGPAVGKTLQRLLEAVLRAKAPNQADALRDLAQQWLRQANAAPEESGAAKE